MEEREGSQAIAWYYKNGYSQYVPYEDSMQQRIEDTFKSFQNNKTTEILDVVIKGKKYSINVKDKKQMNSKTGTVRGILRVAEGEPLPIGNNIQNSNKNNLNPLSDEQKQQKSDIAEVVWEFESDSGWKSHFQENQGELKKGYAEFLKDQTKNQIEIIARHQIYLIDFKIMEQKNKKMNTKRRIRMTLKQ